MNSLYQNQSIQGESISCRQTGSVTEDGRVFTRLVNHQSNKVDLVHGSCGVNTEGQSETLLHEVKRLFSCGLEGYLSVRKPVCFQQRWGLIVCHFRRSTETAEIPCQMLLPLLLLLLLLLLMFGLFLKLLSSSSSCRILMSFCASSSFSRRNSSCCLKNIRKSCRAQRNGLHTDI